MKLNKTAVASTGGRLDVINGLRGFAIIAVLWQHLFGPYFTNGNGFAFDKQILHWTFFLAYGWIGVPLFFLLSGFVLFLPFARGSARMETRNDAARFYRHRAARLLPLYYFAALMSFSLNQLPPVHDARFPAELIAIAGALFAFWQHGYTPHLNPPLWSISVEIWFSILFPVMVVAVRRWGAFKVVVICLVLSFGSRTLGVWIAPQPQPELLPLSRGLVASLATFAMGMLIADKYVAGVRLRNPTAVILLGAVILTVAVALDHAIGRWLSIAFIDVLAAGFACVMAGLLSLDDGALRRAFANRPIQVLGMMCFSIYVWHEPILRHVFDADVAVFSDLDKTLPAYLMLVVIIAALSYRFIEFGKVTDWRSLFLLSRPRSASKRDFEAPRGIMHPLPQAAEPHPSRLSAMAAHTP